MNTTFTSLLLLFNFIYNAMKIKPGFWILILLLFVSIGNTYSQNNKKDVDKYFSDHTSFTQRLWYGGGFNLGFSGGNSYSVFNFGLTPMVGYKILPSLSFGPRVGFDYTYLKGETAIGKKSTNLTTYSMGMFGRLKFLKVLFLHAEYDYESIESAYTDPYGYLLTDPNTNQIRTERTGQDDLLVGAGYNSGEGLFGYEISILYNFNVPVNSTKLPWDIRVGFTYKF